MSRPRPRTKDTDASVLEKKKVFKNFFQAKNVLKKFFFRRSLLEETKKRSLLIFRKVSGVFHRNFNGSKIVLFSSRGQGNFRGLDASRPRTLKCVLEYVLEAKDVLEDSTSDTGYYFMWNETVAGSGSEEIGSCLWKWLKNLSKGILMLFAYTAIHTVTRIAIFLCLPF